MYCVRCGARLEANQRFCPQCGAPATASAPLMPVRSRLAGHVRLLGIFWLAISAFRLIPGIVLLAIFGHHGRWIPEAPPFFVHGLLRTIGFLLLAGAVLGIAAGWGLLERQPWARMLAIVLGVVSLFDMPLGTALGVYTLWALLPAESEQEYGRMAAQAPQAPQ